MDYGFALSFEVFRKISDGVGESVAIDDETFTRAN